MRSFSKSIAFMDSPTSSFCAPTRYESSHKTHQYTTLSECPGVESTAVPGSLEITPYAMESRLFLYLVRNGLYIYVVPCVVNCRSMLWVDRELPWSMAAATHDAVHHEVRDTGPVSGFNKEEVNTKQGVCNHPLVWVHAHGVTMLLSMVSQVFIRTQRHSKTV